ncbi:hypothetical protein LVD15_01965 [Fulvivirga maritima]|uniref:hypothetical protein n=1 Tax=Fulvivirga maritima TaxID=2904247 RepID=UPI001F312E84|nr:hypothetical protein [Fulvivirga maritima]UII27216.1 hypothetical protein LVD15_01965 [Fulvivirga maritima]
MKKVVFVIMIIISLSSCKKPRAAVDYDGLTFRDGVGDGLMLYEKERKSPIQLKLDYDSVVYDEVNGKTFYKDDVLVQLRDEVLFKERNPGYYWLYNLKRSDTLPINLMVNGSYVIRDISFKNDTHDYYMSFTVEEDSTINYEVGPVVYGPFSEIPLL